MERRVVLRKQPRVSWNGDNGDSAGPQHSGNLASRSHIVLDMLEHVGRHNNIKNGILEWELGSCATAVASPPTLESETDRRGIRLDPDYRAKLSISRAVSSGATPEVE